MTAPQPNAGARQEPERRAEPFAEALEREGIVPSIVRIVEQPPPGVGPAFIAGPGDRVAGSARRFAAGPRPPPAGREISITPEGRALPYGVNAAEPVLHEARRVAACTDRPEAEMLADVTRDAGGGEAGGGRLRAVVGPHRQGPDPPRALAANHLGADIHGDGLTAHQSDAAAEERHEIVSEIGAERELVRTLDEEVALLGIEKREAGEVDLSRVHLGLGKIGVHGENPAQLPGHRPADVEPDVAVHLRTPGHEVAAVPDETVGSHCQPETRVQAVHPAQLAGAAHVREARVERRASPAHFGAIARHGADDVESPGPETGGEAERGSRDRHLERPAGGIPPHLGVPDPVPVGRHIFRRCDEAVEARAGSVHQEAVAGPVVSERIEDEPHGVIGGEVGVAQHGVGGDASRFGVDAADADVDRRAVGQQADLGMVRGRTPGHRRLLRQVRDETGRLPVGFVEDAVQANRPSRPAQRHGRSAEVRRRGGQRRRHTRHEDGRDACRACGHSGQRRLHDPEHGMTLHALQGQVDLVSVGVHRNGVSIRSN